MTKWYYTVKEEEMMSCSLCVQDDQLSIITSTKFVSNMTQRVQCRFCHWCPKEDGLIRPSGKKSEYIKKISLWNADKGIFPDKN